MLNDIARVASSVKSQPLSAVGYLVSAIPDYVALALQSRLEFRGIGEIMGSEQRGGGMKYRIVMWAGAGFLVAGFWAFYFFPMAPIPITSAEPIWTLARLTCPVVFAGFYFHFPLGVSWALLANAATYALVGLTVETLRRQHKHAN
jgi:hypothetical protein